MGSFFQKVYHARLHKLFQFVHFGASTLDQDRSSKRTFCQTQHQMKTLGVVEELQENFHKQGCE